MKRTLLSGLALLVWVTVPALADQTYSFTTVISPGDPAFTQLLGINNAGAIAGYFGDGSIVANNGFTLALPNNFTAENFPGSTQTQVVGINNAGETVGFYVDAGGVTHGFTLNGGTFATVDAPGTTFNQLLGVNDVGVAAGYSSLDPTGLTLQQAFTETGSVFTDLALPAGTLDSQATDVNNAGFVSGFYVDAGGNTHGFLVDGSFMTLDAPGATVTQVFGLNNAGKLVGDYMDGTGTHGFVYNIGSSAFQTVDDPFGVGNTTINGINDKGQVVGFYTDANGNVDGFVATPTPEPGSVVLLGTALLAITFRFRKGRTP